VVAHCFLEERKMDATQQLPIFLYHDPFAQEYGQRLQQVAQLLHAKLTTYATTAPQWRQAIAALLAQPRGLRASSVPTTGRISQPDQYIFALHALLAFEMAAQSDRHPIPPRHWEAIFPIAAAWDVFGVTLDLFDDVQDGDLTEGHGYPKELAISVAIGGMGLALALLAEARVAPLVSRAMSQTIGAALFTAAEGQFLDGCFEQMPSVTLNESLHVTALKSGTLIRALYQQSALAGAATRMSLAQAQKLAAACGDFGQTLGEYWQLVNDYNDAAPDSMKSDRTRGKKTLPLTMEAQISSDATATQKRHAGQVTAMFALSLARHRAYDALQVLAQQYTLNVERLLWTVAEEQEEEHA
jgi:geranylgeranyl pyrophosphate synthase